MRVLINLNDQVTVRPTARGLALLKADHEKLFAPHADKYTPRMPDADGTMKMSLWDVMQTFGPHISMGFDLVIETDIELQL